MGTSFTLIGCFWMYRSCGTLWKRSEMEQDFDLGISKAFLLIFFFHVLMLAYWWEKINISNLYQRFIIIYFQYFQKRRICTFFSLIYSKALYTSQTVYIKWTRPHKMHIVYPISSHQINRTHSFYEEDYVQNMPNLSENVIHNVFT